MFRNLNYQIESPEERCRFINDIIEENIVEISNHYKNYFDITKLSCDDTMCQKLEKAADYILYSEKRLDSGILNNSRLDRVEEMEVISYDEAFEENDGDEDNDGSKIANQEKILNGYMVGVSKINNNRRFKENKVVAKDYDTYSELKNYLLVEWCLKKKIERIEQNNNWIIYLFNIHKNEHWLRLRETTYFFEQTLKTIRKEKHNLKELLERPIEFKRLGFCSTNYCFDSIFPFSFSDTDIYDYEKLEDLHYQFHCLIDLYSIIKKYYWEETSHDIWHIIQCFEDLIDSVGFEPYLFDILVWHIDDFDGETIQKLLYEKYGLEYSLPWISKLYRHTILDKLFNKWLDDYEDWLYTYKIRGEWKKCSKCGEVKLATEKYFHKEPKGKDGLKTICKICNKFEKNS